jgi:hypothetical protein
VTLEAAFYDCSKKRVAFFFKVLEFYEDTNFLENIGDIRTSKLTQ